MMKMRLVMLLLPTLASSFSVYQTSTRPSLFSELRSTAATTAVGGGTHGAAAEAHPPMTTHVLDVASIVAHSNYPWTVEALAASAPLMMADPQDTVLLVVQQQAESTMLYSEGPLGRGVGILWVNGDKNDFQRDLSQYDNVQLVSHNVSSSAGSTSMLTTTPVVSPVAFLADLESMGPRMQLPSLQSGSSSSKVQSYLDLQSELQELRNILKPQRRRRSQPRKGISRKQQTKLKKRTTKLSSKQQQQQQSRPGYNCTADAAIFRRRLEECGECQQATFDIATATPFISQIRTMMKRDDDDSITSIDIEGNYYRSPIGGASLGSKVLRVTRRSNITTTLRIVVLSDTHGFEDQFLKHTDERTEHKGSQKYAKLPDADVLIHCGDFEGRNRKLDYFMAAQTHIPTQIVIRGNHDPRQYSFSTADYFTKREMIVLPDGTHLEARPFVRSRSPQATLPLCDIFATHEPPFGICDQTYRQERVGSLTLRHAVEQSHDTPALWLCGHIHEGRGAVWHDFASVAATSTAVVNAANANSGKARRVATGPVVIELVPKDN
jgi:Icc-related predicted phosphoesterase